MNNIERVWLGITTREPDEEEKRIDEPSNRPYISLMDTTPQEGTCRYSMTEAMFRTVTANSKSTPSVFRQCRPD